MYGRGLGQYGGWCIGEFLFSLSGEESKEPRREWSSMAPEI